ncbi:hypothetical protein TNCT_371081 [Trichonephila clavata]|uniref:Transposase Tc1-like domain-containing protein n=1 Tax=Trichonephila clavata TaxID=2740835 RepID=A0A8X6H481_TRICU|nr:hypothetical protein TNCT_371081 [Trichonephila clavata]
MSVRSQRSHLTESEAWRVSSWLEENQTQAEVTDATGVSQSVISRIWKCILETGNASQRPGQGHRFAKTFNEDRYLTLTSWRYRNINATLLQQNLRSDTDTTQGRLYQFCRPGQK